MNGKKLDADAWLNRQVEVLTNELLRLGADQADIDRCRSLGDLLSLKKRTIDDCMGPPKGR